MVFCLIVVCLCSFHMPWGVCCCVCFCEFGFFVMLFFFMCFHEGAVVCACSFVVMLIVVVCVTVCVRCVGCCLICCFVFVSRADVCVVCWLLCCELLL